jgi:hypothetical protein
MSTQAALQASLGGRCAATAMRAIVGYSMRWGLEGAREVFVGAGLLYQQTLGNAIAP